MFRHEIGCPGREETDELALRMLRQLMRREGYSLDIVSSDKLTSEVMVDLDRRKPAAVVIGSLPPGGLAQARYLCKRIRQKAPGLRILVGRWGEHAKNESIEKRLHAAGADRVAWTLSETCCQVLPLLQLASARQPDQVTSR